MNLARLSLLALPAVAILFAGGFSAPAGAAEPPLAHSVFFTLKDRSEASRERFVASCQKYLTGHEGVLSFSVGTIAEDVVEPPSDREFDVALLIVFRSKKDNETYQKSPRHVKFVEENRAHFAKVRVFDTYQAPAKP
ncbi:Dabb family protein [Tundrisphaera sp. TA3]|uniref:Dabb family protein n=1 Tax=Tundrisphaera sp. TA3 TaxID=3435775 RepID=UPI003EBCDE88